jgi:VWFA-related protein
MSDRTSGGWRAGTKTTKATKITRARWLVVLFVAFVVFVLERAPWAVSRQAPPPAQGPTQAQQRPVFRGGTHFVRVDAYPFVDGKIVEGLTPADFEVLEDGKPQKIESFDFMRFDSFTSDAERHDPVSQRAGFDMAADPRYRLFVVYVDLTMTKSANGIENLPLIEQPLVNFFDRIIGPQDLYGLLTTRNSVKDLVLAQKTTVTNSEIKDLLRAKYIERDEADEVLGFCDFGPLCIGCVELLKYLYRADASYTNLHELTVQLGSLRQERKNLVLVTNLLPRWGPNQKFYEALVSGTQGGVSQNGIQNGRLTPDNRDILTNGRGGSVNGCMAEAGRLALKDFEPRYRELLEEAQRQNVSVYVVTPSGLQAPFAGAALRTPAIPSTRAAYEDLRGLAEATDGLAMINTNDLNAAFRRIADDLAGYYVLGYYTTNTKFDGGIRKITVKLKGKPIRARRQYRAPTEEEIATMAQGASASRGAAAQPSGPPAVIGEPAAYRVSRTQPPERVKLLEFVRSDRLRVEWPVLAPLDRREARMLDTAGKPMPFDVPVAEAADGKTLVVELPLAPFARGGYSIELTAASGGRTEQRRLTFIMK